MPMAQTRTAGVCRAAAFNAPVQQQGGHVEGAMGRCKQCLDFEALGVEGKYCQVVVFTIGAAVSSEGAEHRGICRKEQHMHTQSHAPSV